MYNIQEKDWVLWYKVMIASLGGEFTPVEVERSKKITGRRASRINQLPLNPQKYYTDDHGSVRRVKDNAGLV